MSLGTTLRGLVGQLLSDYGEQRDVVLHRVGGTQAPYDTTTGKAQLSPQDHAIKAVVGQVGSGSRPGQGVVDESLRFSEARRVVIAAKELPAGVVPQTGDQLTIDGEARRWSVGPVDAPRLQGTVLVYKLEVLR